MRTDPIILTGCARSGTSLSAGIIHRHGIFGGNVLGATPHNQRGQYENRDIVNHVIKPRLRDLNCDPMGQFPLPTDSQDEPNARFGPDVVSILRKQGLKKQRWYFKGAKCCLIWRSWHHAFPNAQWIIVRREPREIADSCLRTTFMRAYNDTGGWLSWVKEHEHKFDAMKHAGLNLFEFWPGRLFNHDLNHAEDMMEWLGYNFQRQKVTDFLAPNLWSGQGGTKNN